MTSRMDNIPQDAKEQLQARLKIEHQKALDAMQGDHNGEIDTMKRQDQIDMNLMINNHILDLEQTKKPYQERIAGLEQKLAEFQKEVAPLFGQK